MSSRANDGPVAASPVMDRSQETALGALLRSQARQIALHLGAEQRAQATSDRLDALLADQTAPLRDLTYRQTRIAEQVPGVLYQYRLFPDGRSCFPYASDAMRDLHGIDPMEVREDAAPLFAVIHPDDCDRVRTSILHSAETGTEWHEQYRCCHPIKGLIWLEGQAAPERLADGSVLWHGFIVDTTARVETEQGLREARDRYRVATQALGDGAWDLDLRTGKISVDSHFHEMLGFDPADYNVTVESWLSMLHPDDRSRVRRSIRYQWIRGNKTALEYRHRTASGGWMWIESRGLVLERDRGWPMRIIGTNRDISDRKAMEAALQDSEKRFRTLFEYAPMAYMALDAAGRVVDLNVPLCRMLHRNRSQILGQIFSAFLAPNGHPTGVHHLTRLLHNDRTTTDLEIQKPDGSSLSVELISQSQQDKDGALVRIHCVVHDISDHARLEARLARSNSDLSQFAYAVSHDLREPLRMVSGFLGLIEHRMADTTDPDLGEFLGFAIDGAKRLDRMILDLLDYSRIGRDGSETGPIGLQDALGEALNNLTAAIQERTAVVDVADTLPTISGRRSNMVRLFQNLIGNAIKFVPTDRVPRIQVFCREQNATHWRLSIRDNGVGIPLDKRERVFGVFERLVRQDQVAGTGIGLALCRKIVERHGGEIWFADAEEDRSPMAQLTPTILPGAIVHFTLPKQTVDTLAAPGTRLDRITLLDALNTHQMRISARLRNLMDTINNRKADKPTILGEIDFLVREVERYRVFVHANTSTIFGYGLSINDEDPAADADSLMFSVLQLHRTLEEQDVTTMDGLQVIGHTLQTLLQHLSRSHALLQKRRAERLSEHRGALVSAGTHATDADSPAYTARNSAPIASNGRHGLDLTGGDGQSPC